ncbi:MAG TPA: serine/threonine-protein kinase, partial [Myxococcales bacterium]
SATAAAAAHGRVSTVDGVAVTAEAALGYLPRGTAVGRYLVVGFLGEGGMATVYSAYDPELGRKVAIKLLKFQGGDVEVARAQLQREAQAMARLSHPNVVPVYDAGTHEGQLFVAMELVEGQTLHNWLATGGRKRREIVEVFCAAGEGLAAAHRAGLVHRDFKPENVLVGRDGRIRVSDFGLARVDCDPTASGSGSQRISVRDTAPIHETYTGSLTGTPAYMAPEQLLGQSTDPRTDQFSFCAALWEALTGELPFGDGDFVEIRRAVLGASLKPPARPMPRWLQRTLAKGLSIAPDDRYPSMPVLLAVFRRAPSHQLRRLAVPGAVALASLAVLGTAGWQWRQETTACERQVRGQADALWGARRGEVERALSGVPGQQAADVLGTLDARVAAWAQLERAACEEKRQGAKGGALVVGDCLERYRVDTAVAVDTFAQKQPAIAEAGRVLLDELGSPERCQAMKAPASKHLESAELRKATAEVRVLAQLGKHGQLMEKAAALLPQAREQGALSLVSVLEEAMGGSIATAQGPKPEALDLMRSAVRDADASGDDEQSLKARISLFYALFDRFGSMAEADQVSQDAEAWLRRLGTPPHLEQRFATQRATLLTALNRHDEALAAFERVLELVERGDATPSERGAARNNLGLQLMVLGRYAESARELEKALDLLSNAPWVSTLDLVAITGNLAILRAEQGRSREALEAFEKAGAMLVGLAEDVVSYRTWLDGRRAQVLEDLGRDAQAWKVYRGLLEKPEDLDPKLKCIAFTGEARALTAEGKYAEAIKTAQNAIPLTPDPQAQAQARFALGQALAASGKDPHRALEEARTALLAYKGPEDSFRRGQIERWIAANPAPEK